MSGYKSLIAWYKLTGSIVCLHIVDIDSGEQDFLNMEAEDAEFMFNQSFTA